MNATTEPPNTTRIAMTLKVAGLVGAAAAVAVYWTLIVQQSQLATAVQEQRASTERPYLLNGLIVPPSVWGLSGVGQTSGRGRHLVIVTSDSCSICASNVSAWQQLIEQLPFKDGDDVTVVSFDGDSIPSQLLPVLRRTLVRHTVTTTPSLERVRALTGINATPFTIVLDEQYRARLISNSADEAFLALARQFFGRSEVNSRSF